MKRSLIGKLFYLTLILPVVLGCNLAGVVKKAVDNSRQPLTLTSPDSKTQLTLPGGWREEKVLNDVAILQGAQRFQELYVVVLRENRQDFADEATLEDFAGLARNGLISTVQEPQATEPVATQVGSYPAMEYRLDGTVDKVKIKYLCTMVETPKHYYQILTWTLASRFDMSQGTLREVTQSFRELNPD